MKITIGHLYPQLLNLYSDRGNIMTLCYRLEQRGIEAQVVQYDTNDIDFENTDILYIGGGTDREQQLVCNKLSEVRDAIGEYIEQGGCMLATCGGFEMLGKNFCGGDGLGILDITTEYASDRFIGDAVIQSEVTGGSIVGFENHNGRINIGSYNPLGKVTCGNGNNGADGTEGLVYKNLVATYLHGPVLPKNPKLADYIIKCAIDRKYNTDTQLEMLDDTTEELAHKYIVDRCNK